MIVYLATPYSHPDPAVREARHEMACLAAATLLERGQLVFCPVAHSHRIGEILGRQVDHDFWMRVDLKLLEKCDELIVLMAGGWRESRGVQAEIARANELGIPVRHLFPQDLGAGV